MKKEILELEKILEQEIEACSKLEQYVSDKREYLVKGDIENLIKTDMELEKYNVTVQKLEEKRKRMFPESAAISEIIDKMEEKSRAEYIEGLKDKLKNSLLNIEKENNISAELIKQSLRVVESSILSITRVLVPESTHYNSRGQVTKKENREIISSVIHEA